MKKSFIYLILLAVVICVLVSCNKGEEDSMSGSEINEDTIAETLDVYIVADMVHGYDASEETEVTWYTSFFNIGDFFGVPLEFGESGFMYYEAIKDYTESTGINLNIKWYQWPEVLEDDLKQMSKDEHPDLIISTFTSMEDYYSCIDQGMFYDLSSYVEQEEMYTNDEYYTQVLKGGELNQKQYVLPILFTVDTIMGSEESWNKFSLHLDETENYSEFLDTLIYAQNQEMDGMVAFQYNCISAWYLPHMMYSASGEKWIDYENMTFNLDENNFRKMCYFYDYFLDEQFDEASIMQGESILWHDSLEMRIKEQILNEVQMEEFLNEFGCIIEGGSSMQTYLHSAAAQAWYYESRYSDLKENFSLMAIPNENGSSSARISYFGAVMESSDNPEGAFDFLKFLLDTEVSPFFGLSVNKKNTSQQLDYLTNTTYRIRPGLKIPLEDGSIPDSKADYVIKPMTEDTRNAIEEIIDNIEITTLPNWPVYLILDTQMQAYAKGEISIEDAYENAKKELNNYVIMLENSAMVEDSESEDSKVTYWEPVKSDEEIEEEKRMEEHHKRMDITVYVLLLCCGLFLFIMLIITMIRLLKKHKGRVRIVRVQIAALERSNGEPERNIRMTQGGENGLSSTMGRGVSGMIYIKAYQIGKKNKMLRLKTPIEYVGELNEGDIGTLKYIGEEILAFTKDGSISEEDNKKVKFKL